MELQFDLEKIVNCERLWDNDELNPLTKALILLSVTVGMGRITRHNYREFYLRVTMAEQVMGPILTRGTEHRAMTLVDIRCHIGLETNAPLKSRPRFKRSLLECLARISHTVSRNIAM